MSTKTKQDGEWQITNCHVHTFTLKHVPRNFLPFRLTQALAFLPFQKTLARALRWVNPFHDRDKLSRYANFLEIGGQRTQEEIFDVIKGYYPDGSRFVVLPMDMSFMGKGDPLQDLKEQHDQLEALADKYPSQCLPFFAVDPRRYQGREGQKALENELKARFPTNKTPLNRVFRGIKLYPPLGYDPFAEEIKFMWDYCEEYSVPVMTHCSRGGVHTNHYPREKRERFTDPDSYLPILERHPKARVCLAHFGGFDDWTSYFEIPGSRRKVPLDASRADRAHMNWVSKIVQIIESGNYPGLYTDVSYTVFATQKLLPAISVILKNSAAVRVKTLFGSDYYMTQNEKFDERYLSMQLRHALGEDVFYEIANKNPATFLGEV